MIAIIDYGMGNLRSVQKAFEAVGAKAVFIGANALDYSGYPDCRPEFFTAFQAALDQGLKAGIEKKGIRILTPLVDMSKADIVVEGFRPGVADRLGIGYRDLSAVNPRIIYCAATGYGQTGPWAMEVGHDLNYQAVTGALSLAGRTAEGTPAVPGSTFADSAGGGWQGAMLILAAIVERVRTGRGKFVDLSAAEGMLQLMSVVIDEQLATGVSAADLPQSGKFACNNIYATADGESVALAAFETKFFANACKVLGLEDKVGLQNKKEAQPELFRALADVFKTRTRAEWVERFAGVEACFTPVLSIEEVMQHPHWKARKVFVEYDHPQAGHATQVGPLGGGDSRGPAPDASPKSSRSIIWI